MVYKTYASAETRVFALVAAIGAWPGITRCEGGWRLTYDVPPGALQEMDAHGYLLGPGG